MGDYDEKVYGLYGSVMSIWMMNSKRLRQAGFVVRMGKTLNAYTVAGYKPL